MFKQTVMVAIFAAASAGATTAQGKKPAGTNAVTYDVSIQADGTYTGTIDIAVAKGVASGDMRIKVPTEVIGKVAGTSKGGELKLDFPYTMVERNCTGQIEMNIKMPAKPGPATGTVAIAGCGREVTNKLTGTIDLKPAVKK